MTILDEILARKRDEVAGARLRVSAADVGAAADAAPAPRGFRAALAGASGPAVIAEIKRRSPSGGEIRADFDPVACAGAYAAGGASALSVLTDAHFFGGALEHLVAARAAVTLPVLRKDFVVDRYQIDEARAHGADAVLLIVAALDPVALGELFSHARARDLDVLVEVHDEAELRVALDTGADLVGVNNRDLRTFVTDLATTERLAPGVPPSVLLVAESGISGSADVRRLAGAGARAFLVGESLMRQDDLEAALRRLLGREDPEPR
jgi:indole-3-glycerol phosphate synthase